MKRCKEHGLYLYFDHYGKNGEEYYTCKLGCLEFFFKGDCHTIPKGCDSE